MLIFGHRGSPRRFPENTVASFREAVRVGADGFETDLRQLADGKAILFHDDEVGTERVESLTADDLVRRGLHLTAVRDLAQFAGRTTMVLEVKRGGWEGALLAEIEAWSPIVVASFDHELIARLARRNVKFPLGLTFSGSIIDLPAYARRAGATWVFPNYRHVDGDLVAALGRQNVMTVPWTPNDRREWERLRALGCHGIITDEPEAAVRWRGETP